MQVSNRQFQFLPKREKIGIRFPQLYDQFMIIKNYAKDIDKVLGKLTHLQSSNILTIKCKAHWLS